MVLSTRFARWLEAMSRPSLVKTYRLSPQSSRRRKPTPGSHVTKYVRYAATAQQKSIPPASARRTRCEPNRSNPAAAKTARHGVAPDRYEAFAQLKIGSVRYICTTAASKHPTLTTANHKPVEPVANVRPKARPTPAKINIVGNIASHIPHDINSKCHGGRNSNKRTPLKNPSAQSVE